MRDRLRHESQARTSQAIEELQRICHEETNPVRKLKIEELSPRQEGDPATVSQLLAQILDLHYQVNSLADAREFHDLDTASSSGGSHVPSQPLTLPSAREVLSRDSGLPPKYRNTIGTSGNVFESLLVGEGSSSAVFANSRNLAASSCGLRPETTGKAMAPEREVTREPQNSSITIPRFQRGAGVSDHSVGTSSHDGMIDCPRFPISEMRHGKFPDSMEFQSWKVNFKTEACSKSADPHLTMPGSEKLR